MAEKYQRKLFQLNKYIYEDNKGLKINNIDKKFEIQKRLVYSIRILERQIKDRQIIAFSLQNQANSDEYTKRTKLEFQTYNIEQLIFKKLRTYFLVIKNKSKTKSERYKTIVNTICKRFDVKIFDTYKHFLIEMRRNANIKYGTTILFERISGFFERKKLNFYRKFIRSVSDTTKDRLSMFKTVIKSLVYAESRLTRQSFIKIVRFSLEKKTKNLECINKLSCYFNYLDIRDIHKTFKTQKEYNTLCKNSKTQATLALRNLVKFKINQKKREIVKFIQKKYSKKQDKDLLYIKKPLARILNRTFVLKKQAYFNSVKFYIPKGISDEKMEIYEEGFNAINTIFLRQASYGFSFLQSSRTQLEVLNVQEVTQNERLTYNRKSNLEFSSIINDSKYNLLSPHRSGYTSTTIGASRKV